jgi:hypothetical protein
MKHRHRLAQALKGISIANAPPKQKSPITIELLERLKNLAYSTYDTYMIWAAMNLGYFGLLRAGEYCTTESTFKVERDLCLGDILCEKDSLVVLIKHSKTDKNSNGIKICIGCSGRSVCAVCTMIHYNLKNRKTMFGSNPHIPLFIFPDGTALSRAVFTKHIKLQIAMLGYNSDSYSGHSLRAGGCSDAARNGLSDWEIKVMGRWTSNAYERYIRLPLEFRLKFAKIMVNH